MLVHVQNLVMMLEFGWQQNQMFIQIELEQLKRLRSEILPAAPWLPILVIHIRSQVKTDKVKVRNVKNLPKIQI